MKTKLCRSVLVETEQHSDIIFIAEIKMLMQRSKLTHNEDLLNELGVNKQLILISLDPYEKVEVEDKYYDDHNNLILTATTQSDHNFYHYKKVIATQDQISPEYVQQLIDEYNNGGMKDFEIEMFRPNEPYQISEHWSPKLTNGFVTIVEKASITYTEKEVIDLLYKCWIKSAIKTLNPLKEEGFKSFIEKHLSPNTK